MLVWWEYWLLPDSAQMLHPCAAKHSVSLLLDKTTLCLAVRINSRSTKYHLKSINGLPAHYVTFSSQCKSFHMQYLTLSAQDVAFCSQLLYRSILQWLLFPSQCLGISCARHYDSCAVRIISCAECHVSCAVRISSCAKHSVSCAVHGVLSTECSVPFIVLSLPFAVVSISCARHSVSWSVGQCLEFPITALIVPFAVPSIPWTRRNISCARCSVSCVSSA